MTLRVINLTSLPIALASGHTLRVGLTDLSASETPPDMHGLRRLAQAGLVRVDFTNVSKSKAKRIAIQENTESVKETKRKYTRKKKSTKRSIKVSCPQ